jgi:elongation factor G
MSLEIGKIRNLVLVGHGNTGKTTLVEALLHKAGVTQRMGTVEQGNTVCDFDDLEKERKHSIDSAGVWFDTNGYRIELVDTPGYPDFIGQALMALPGVETAMVVVSAVTGIEVNTRKMFGAAGDYGLARVVVINKIDHENIDLANVVKSLQDTFGKNLLPLNLPAGGGKSVVNCLGGSGETDFGDIEEARVALMETVVESDEKLMERYLGGETISQEELTGALKKAMAGGAVIPIVFTSGRTGAGLPELLELITGCCPSPAEGLKRTLVMGEGEARKEEVIEPKVNGPLVGQVIKSYSDPRSNIKYSMVRLHSGLVKSDTNFIVGEERKGVRAGHVYLARGAENQEVPDAGAGQICILAKIDELHVGNLIHSDKHGSLLPVVRLPEPMFSLAIEPKSRGDETKISGALHRLAEEDKTFKNTRDRQTNETVISGIGDLHLRVMLSKMERRFKLEVTTKVPKIPYRETVTQYAEGHYRHKKQTGGAGQFGEVYLKVEPMDRNTGFEFVDEIFGGSIPGQYLPAIEKGVRDLLEQGAVAGFPMQDLRVRVYDGKHHPVDSKEVAFRIAGKLAAKDAILKAKPVLLEPVVLLEVTVPAQFVGDITGDLSGRRGRILGQDMLPGNMAVIKAQVPLSEVAQYNSQLRSVTGGQGSYSMELSHYDAVPPNIQQDVIKHYKPKAGEEEEKEE